MENKVKSIAMLVVFLICLSMIILGQRNVGYTGLAVEFVGLIGLLIILYIYNKEHK